MSALGADPLTALAGIEVPAWLVGGALRDRLLGRPTADYDVAVAGDARAVARTLARSLSGHSFELSEAFGAWRVMARDRGWNIDVLPLSGGTIEGDLARRDFTVNAMAQPLADGDLVDPFGGLGDLRAGRLRVLSAAAFAEDPLRTLRLPRLAVELGFSIDPVTGEQAKAAGEALGQVAPERVFAELKRIVAAEQAVRGVQLLDELGLTAVILPELSALHGVEQSAYHHLDVYEHTLAVLAEVVELERDPQQRLGPHAAAVDEYLSTGLANELTRWQALRFGALLHDIAKPQTRRVTPEGRVTFMGHDAAGGEIVRALFGRLRASERLGDHVAALTRHHLRLGFLVRDAPLSRRAVYRYLRECAPVGVEVTVLSVADRVATRGLRSAEAIAGHLELAGQLLGEALAWAAAPPRPPIRGDELARTLGLTPGPELGRILSELEEASFAQEIGSPEEAVDRARELLGGRSIGSRP